MQIKWVFIIAETIILALSEKPGMHEKWKIRSDVSFCKQIRKYSRFSSTRREYRRRQTSWHARECQHSPSFCFLWVRRRSSLLIKYDKQNYNNKMLI